MVGQNKANVNKSANGKDAATAAKPVEAVKPSQQVNTATSAEIAKREAAQNGAVATSQRMPSQVGAFEDAFDVEAATQKGDVVTGGFDGVLWVPHYSKFTPDYIAGKMKDRAYTKAPIIGGVFGQELCWGKMAYVVDAPVKADKGGGFIRVKLPSHKGLYGLLKNVPLGTRLTISHDGEGEAKPNQSAPQRYSLRMEAGVKLLSAPRPDALEVIIEKDGDDLVGHDVVDAEVIARS